MTPIPAGEVLPGTLVFLDCGCAGIRGATATEPPVGVLVHCPCADHEAKGPGQSRTFEPWELVSPLAPYLTE